MINIAQRGDELRLSLPHVKIQLKGKNIDNIELSGYSRLELIRTYKVSVRQSRNLGLLLLVIMAEVRGIQVKKQGEEN